MITPDDQGQHGPAASEQVDPERTDEARDAVVGSTDPMQLESRWVLDFVTTPQAGPVRADTQLSTELTFGDGAVFGRGGVNRFRGSYEAGDDGTLTFGGIAGTRMAGPERAMAQENGLLTALSATVAFQIVGDRLLLRGTDGETVAVLVRTAQEDVPD